MKINWETLSYIFAIAITLAALASPIVTAIINNIYQTKRENIINYELAKRKALENYVEIASKCSDTISIGLKDNYIKSANTLYIYFSNVPSEVDYLLDMNGNDFNEILTRIVQDLSEQIAKK